MNGFIVPALAQQELAVRLGEAHHFTPADLELNREGKISGSQWWRLISEAMHPFLRAGAGAALLLACLAGVYSLVSRQSSVATIIYLALTAAAFGLGATLIKLGKLAIDFAQGQVCEISGRLNPSWEDRGRGLVNSSETGSRSKAAYRYTVAGEVFWVNDRVYRLLNDHFELGYPTVKLYYTPHTRHILSLQISGMEPMQAAASHPAKARTPGLWRY